MLGIRPNPKSGFTRVVGIGGIGIGVVFELEGTHTLGREESRLGTLLAGRDYCKLHIVEHYIAAMMGVNSAPSEFEVAAIGVIGEDGGGRRLTEEMRRTGIDTTWVRSDATRGTLFSTCFIYPDRTGGNITSNNSAAAALNEQDLQQAADTMRTAGGRCVALCLPEVPLDIRRRFLEKATEYGNFRAASFTLGEIAPAEELNLFSMVDLLAINQEEASALVGYAYTAEDTEGFLSRCSAALTAEQPEMRIVISAGANGAYGFEHERWIHYPSPEVPVASTAGAGDALLAGVLCGLAAGLPLLSRSSRARKVIDAALPLGVLLASFSVTSPDTIHFQANMQALEEFAAGLGITFADEVRKVFRGEE